MAANKNDLFMFVGEPGTATTLSAPGYTAGGTSMTVGSTTGWPTTTGTIFAVDEAEVVNGVEVQIAGTYNEYAGVVSSGTSLTTVEWQLGVGDRNYAAGALTRVYIPVSAERENRIADGITREHGQDGAHIMVRPRVTTSIDDTNGNELLKVTATASAVNELTLANAATGNGPVLSATGGDTNVDINLTPKGSGVVKIGGSPFTHGASVAWTPTWTNFTTGNGTNGSTYTQMGKLVFFELLFTLGSTSAVTGDPIFTLPVTSIAYTGQFQAIIGRQGIVTDVSASAFFPCHVLWYSTTQGQVNVESAAGANVATSGITSINPMTWATGDKISVSGFYRAA